MDNWPLQHSWQMWPILLVVVLVVLLVVVVDDQYYEDGWGDEDEAQENAPKMDPKAMKRTEKFACRSCSSLFELLVAFSSEVQPRIKMFLCSPLPRKEKCTKVATTQAQPICDNYIITHIQLHSVALYGITFHIALCIEWNYIALQNVRLKYSTSTSVALHSALP